MKSTYLLIPLLVIFSKQGIKAQGIDTIRLNSLNEVIQTAIKNNPTQAVYQQQVRQSNYNYKASKSWLYPSLSAGFDGTDNLHLATTPVPGVIFGQPGTTLYLRFGKKYIYNTGLTFNKDILNWPAVLQMKIADKSLELTHLQQAAYEQGLKEQAARLYFTALIASSALQINNRDRLLADSVVTLAKQKLEEGVTDLLSVNSASISSSIIQQNEAQSRQLLDQSIENLKILLGTKPATELQLQNNPDLDSVAYAELISMQADRNLDVYRKQGDIAAMQSRAQKANAYPTIKVSGFLGDQQFRDDLGLSFARSDWSAYSYIDLNITVPIFTGLSNHYKYRSAQVQQKIADLQFQSASDQSAINDRLLLKNYSDYLQMVKASKTSFRLYGENVRLNQQKYMEGLTSLDVYMKAFQDYLAAENTYLNDLSQLLTIKSTIISRQ